MLGIPAEAMQASLSPKTADEMEQQQIPPILSALANAVYPPFVLALCIGLPSAVLYALQLGLIIRHRHSHFKSSFFKLFAVRVIATFVGFIGAFLHQRFGLLGLFLPLYLQLPSFCIAFFYFLIVHSVQVENLATVVLLLNRLTAIAVPLQYEQLWKRTIPWAIALVFLLPLPLSWHVLTYDVSVRVQPDNSTFTLYHERRPNDLDDVKIGALSGAVFTLVCLAINLGCLVAYRHSKKRVQQHTEQSRQERQAMETKLTVHTLLSFVGQLLGIIYMFFLYLAVTLTQKWGLSPPLSEAIFFAVFNQMPWVNDLCSIALPAWFLLWASGEMRKQFASAFASISCQCFRLKQQSSASGPVTTRVAWIAAQQKGK